MFRLGHKIPTTGQPSGTYLASYLGGVTEICNWPDLRYMPGFIFWVGKQVAATGQVSGIYQASYFWWENRYL